MKNARRQPQRVPPPLLSGNEKIEGEGILHEFPGDPGLVLWKTYRGVALWVQLTTEERRELVCEEACRSRADLVGATPELEEIAIPLIGLAEMYQRPITRSMVVARCRAIERWAEAGLAPRTALEFGQLAALAAPDDANVAVGVAKRGRDLAEYARAESWYWQAVVRARRRADWAAYVYSMLGLGVTHRLRGNYPAARRNMERGLRRARRQGLRTEEGMALHELTVLATKSDNVRKVVYYGRMAAAVYGPTHPRLPALSHDIAIYWMNRGYFGPALRLVQAISPDYGSAADQLSLAASRARAAGALQDTALFDGAFARAESLLENPQTASRASSSLLDIARGAISMGDTERAMEAASRAFAFATTRGESEHMLEAESVLQEIRTTEVLHRVARVRPPAEIVEFAAQLAEILEPATLGAP